MSVTTTKLDYARIRNANRKNNKSLHSLQDTTNLQNNLINQNFQSEALKSQQEHRQLENKENKRTPLQNNNDFLNQFDSNFYAGNLEYINSLITNNNKSPSPISAKEHASQKVVSHKKTVSSVTESSHKLKFKYANDENIEPMDNDPKIQTTPNMKVKPTISKSKNNLASKLNNNLQIGNMTSDKEINYRTNMNPNNTPSMKEGNLFDQFFKKGALERRSMSLEDLRLAKLGLKSEEKNFENFREGVSNEAIVVNNLERNPLGKPDLSARKDFVSNLNSYIHYFDNSISHRSKEMIAKKYFLSPEQGQKGSQYLQKELELAKNEAKLLRKQADILQNKMLEITKINKHLMKELNDMKLKEEAYQETINQIEDRTAQVSQRKNHYKGKLIQMQELLELERIDNENNMEVLKRVLETHGVDNRALTYISKGREKPPGDKDYLKNALKDLLQQKKGKILTTNPLKEKKPNLLPNNRYDSQVNKQINKNNKGNKDTKRYNLSLLSQKLDFDHDIHELTSDSNNQSNPTIAYGNIDHAYEQDLYASEMYEERLIKDQHIKYLQDKLIELMEGQEPSPYLKDKAPNQRNLKLQKNRSAEPNMNDELAPRGKKGSFLKFNNDPYRSEMQLNTKMKSNAKNSPPTNEIENLSSPANRSEES